MPGSRQEAPAGSAQGFFNGGTPILSRMPAQTEAAMPSDATAAPKQGGRRKLLLLIAAPILLGSVGAGLWFGGILPSLLGAQPSTAAGAAPQADATRQPSFLDMPEVIANLNAPGRRPVFVRLRAKLEVARAEDGAAFQAAMPRLLDLFQIYLREMRPEELRGSIGTQRLREELILRANLAAHPARLSDILFTEILVQ